MNSMLMLTPFSAGFGDYIVSGNCIYDPKWKAVHKCAFFIWIVFGLSFVAQVINEIRQALDKLETYVRQKLVKQSNTVEPEDNVTEVSETD